MKHWGARNFWWLVLLLLPLWPLRVSLVTGEIPGAGPDVLSTLWGMWWFGQEWLGAAWGGWTGLANGGLDVHGRAYGAYGSVLSPLSAVMWNLLEPMVGIGRSMALVGAFQLGALAACTGLLVRDLKGSRAAALVAGLGVLGLRQSFFGLAEGSVVAVTALFVPLGIVCLRRSACLNRTEHSRRKWAAGAGLSMVALSLENPYLAPLLPGWALCMLLGMGWRWRAHGQRPSSIQTLATGFLGGVMGMGAVAWLFGRTASPDYPTRLGDHFVSFFGLPIEVVEQAWARMGPSEWLNPVAVQWTLDHTQGVMAHGDGYLGVVLFGLAIGALVFARRTSWPYLTLGLSGLVLSMGSVMGDTPLPFGLLNALMDVVARPLTQPSRFLSLAGIGLSISAALTFDYIRQRWRWRMAGPVLTVLCLDSFVWGGLSLELPRTPVPHANCVAELAKEPKGLVVMWPEDASRYEGDLGRTWLHQMLHEQPSVHPGIASWQLHNGRSRDVLREELGLMYMAEIGEAMGQPVGRPDVDGMRRMGIDWVVVDLIRDERQSDWATGNFGPPERECPGYQIHRIGDE